MVLKFFLSFPLWREKNFQLFPLSLSVYLNVKSPWKRVQYVMSPENESKSYDVKIFVPCATFSRPKIKQTKKPPQAVTSHLMALHNYLGNINVCFPVFFVFAEVYLFNKTNILNLHYVSPSILMSERRNMMRYGISPTPIYTTNICD